MNFIRKFTLSSLIAAVAVLTGCANIQPKMDAFEQQSKRLGVIYAQVNKVTPSEDWGYCDSSRASMQAKKSVCKPQMNAVLVSWASKGSYTASMVEAIPNDIELSPGAIIAVDMGKPLAQRFMFVASKQETEGCHWNGRRNVLLDSGVRKFTEFTTVFVAVAAAPVLGAGLLYGQDDLGGIVCNNWNYQEAYKDKDISSLFAIF
jgi:outer membrane murein-binding lipoprotein Lpp